MRLEVDPATNDATLLFRKSARSSWPSPIWLRQWSSLPMANDQVQSLEFRQGSDITLDGIVLVSYEEWPNGEWANGIVPENYFRLFTIPGPSYDSTDNILEFHSAPTLTEIDPPPASWARHNNNETIPPAKIPLSSFAPTQRLTVQRTQRNITVGNYRFIDKASSIASIPFGGPWTTLELSLIHI